MVRIAYYSLFVLFTISQAHASAQQWQARSKDTFKGKTSELVVKDSENTTTLKLSVRPQGQTSSLTQQQSLKALSINTSDVVRPANYDIWVYDAHTHLLRDYDHDNYYYVFNVTFDVDTMYSHADVYARLYLGDGEIYREYHTTSVFHIDYTDGDDEFEVETELLSGYSSWDYDILIEIYDADTNLLVAVYDQLDDADLSYLPLESYDYEYRYVAAPPVAISREHGGSLGITWLMGVVLLIVYRGWTVSRRKH